MHSVRDPAVDAAIAGSRHSPVTPAALIRAAYFLISLSTKFLEVVRRRQTLRSVMARRSINGSCCNLGRDAASSFFDDPIRRKLA